ncbi:MAG: polysaccharide pyruvyl transferase family protein [Ancrocorticia sp.]
MKIGLIGINKYAKFLNFACDLHIYAFQQFLKQHGYESTILDYKPAYYGNFDMRHPAEGAKQQYLDALRNKKDPATIRKRAELALGYWTAEEERERRLDKFEHFAQENLIFTEEVYDSDLLETRDPGFDCYICVTDVIWQTIPRHTFDRGFLLGSKAFDGKAKIAYAASRGASGDLTDDQLALFKQYVDRFDAVSIREDDFRSYVDDNTNTSPELVLDPVLLHDRTLWDELAVTPREQGYVLLYYVMEQSKDTIAKAVEYAKLHNLTFVELSDRPFKYGKVTDPDVKHIARYDVGMEEWLGYIRSADAVFTNSFHGCCFSMLFEKLFFVGSRNGQKVPSFLRSFGLEEQQFDMDDDVRDFASAIDYTSARTALDQGRQRSSNFILTALSEAERRTQEESEQDIERANLYRYGLTYPILFHSGAAQSPSVIVQTTENMPRSKQLDSNRLEYTWRGTTVQNDGSFQIPKSLFQAKDRNFTGWTLRFRIDNRWFWYLEDGSVEASDVNGKELEARKAVLEDGAVIPHLPVNRIAAAVLVAQWDGGKGLGSGDGPDQAKSRTHVRVLKRYKDQKGNRIEYDGPPISTNIDIQFQGSNNVLRIANPVMIGSLSAIFTGNEGFVSIAETTKKRTGLRFDLVIREKSSIRIGANVGAETKALVRASGGASVIIGNDCMLASNVEIATDEDHAIYDTVTGSRTNPARDITIGEHVWLGKHAAVSGGVTIGSGSIVGFRSIVTKDIPNNVVAAGAPARVVRENVAWERPTLAKTEPGTNTVPSGQRANESFWNPTMDDEPPVISLPRPNGLVRARRRIGRFLAK